MVRKVAFISSFIILSTQCFATSGAYLGGGVALNVTTSENIYKTYWQQGGAWQQPVATGSYLGTQTRNSIGDFFSGGYQFNDYFATEVNYLWSNNQVYTPSPNDNGNTTFLGSQNLVSVNALFLYPFTDWFQLKVRGGVAYERATMTDYVGSPMTDGFTSVLGLGTAFYIFRHISLDLDYIGYGLLFPMSLNYHPNGNNFNGVAQPQTASTVINNDFILSVNYHFN